MIDADTLRSYRRYAIIAIFIAAALLSHPTLLSQLAVAVPLLLLCEAAILLSPKRSQ
jgi:sec-independent protein translocase protein TatC